MYKVYLKRGEERRIKKGHPWVYANEVQTVEGKAPNGSLAEVYDSGGNFLGKGYINRLSKILVRLFIYNREEEDTEQLFSERLIRANALRENIGLGDAYRLCFSESDGLPSLIVDRYGDVYVVEILSLGMRLKQDTIVSCLVKAFHPKCIYSRSDGFVARQQLVKDAYPVLVRSSDGFLIPLNESAGDIFGEDEHAVQFRCESENTFFFMPPKESPDGVAGVPIYRFDIDRALLDNSSTEGLNEDGYLELARLGVKVTKVFDGSTTVAVADKYSPIRWCVSGNNVLLNENEILVDGVVRQIERVAGQSDSFIGTPAIVVAPDGDFMAIINTASGLYVHRLVKNGETWSWQIDSPELDLGGHWNITEAFVEGDATLVGNGRYYKWNSLGELVSSDFYYFNELYFPCDNYYPHNEHYVYSTRYDDVLQRAKPESLGVRESIYFSVGGKIVDFSVMNDVVVVSVEGNRFCIVENGEQGDIVGSDKYEITEYTARIK